MAFLDFGMTKTVPRATIETELGVLRAGLDRDAAGVHAGLAALGFFDPERSALRSVRGARARARPERLVRRATSPLTMTPEYVLAAHASTPEIRARSTGT